jgi:hypothetical protein
MALQAPDDTVSKARPVLGRAFFCYQLDHQR